MPLTGGASDKLGNSFEANWTVYCFAQVLKGLAYLIRLEPPGPEDEGAEFWLSKGQDLEYHQVKRQITKEGRWSIGELKTKKVLENFHRILQNNATTSCYFVSTHAAFQLEELANRARWAVSLAEFEKIFLKTSYLREWFEEIMPNLGGTPESCFANLKRIYVETISENALNDLVLTSLMTLVEGDSITVGDVLGGWIPKKIHERINAFEIRNFLQTKGYSFLNLSNNLRVLNKIDEANKRFIRLIAQSSLFDEIIVRDEVGIVIEKLTNPLVEHSRRIILAGGAGIGKSSILNQIIEHFQKNTWPIISMRVDKLKSTQLPEEIGQQLYGVNESPTSILARFAQSKDCLLVIDQLDAISLISGNRREILDPLEEILDQTKQFTNMRVLIACRNFDLENDERLRRVSEPKDFVDILPIGYLTPEKIKSTLAKIIGSEKIITSSQLELLSYPLHLGLLISTLKKSKENSDVTFNSTKDLFDNFWETKKQAINERLGKDTSNDCDYVLNILSNSMSIAQQLQAPKIIVRNYSQIVKALVSENVLIADKQQYSFFHQGFFDFAFAYSFAAKNESLTTILLESEQHLFRRAQVRQVLAYIREHNFIQYLSEINTLLTNPQIRFHLKQIAHLFLKSLADPTEEEWRLLALPDPDELDPTNRMIWIIIYGSSSWFNLLDEMGLIEQCLASETNELLIDKVVENLFYGVHNQNPTRITDLLIKYVDFSNERWRRRLINLFATLNLNLDRRLFDLFLNLIKEGGYDFVDENGFWYILYDLVKSNPSRACEAMKFRFDRNLKIVLDAHPNEFTKNEKYFLADYVFKDTDVGEEVIPACAIKAPDKFIEQLLPLCLDMLNLTHFSNSTPPLVDGIWHHRNYQYYPSISTLLLGGLEISLAKIAEVAPDVFRTYLEKYNLKASNYETIQFLLVRAFAANGSEFADEAVEFILTSPDRLRLGYVENSSLATSNLLEAVTPFCSDLNLKRLEDIVLQYFPDGEKYPNKFWGVSAHGRSQFRLLRSMSNSRLSPLAFRRLQELKRKFDKEHDKEPKNIVGIVESPISQNAIKKMTDKQWLRAIARYDVTIEMNTRQDTLVGGAFQLAQMLENEANLDPIRFSDLILKFPSNTNPVYFQMVIRSLVNPEVKLDLQKSIEICRYMDQLPDRPYGKEVCILITRIAGFTLPHDLLEMIAWYSINDPDPEKENWHLQEDGQAGLFGLRITDGGINSTRGLAAKSIAELLKIDNSRLTFFLPIVREMVSDPIIAVRSCVAEALIAILKIDRTEAITLFLKLSECDEILLQTLPIAEFLSEALKTDFNKFEHILSIMISSENEQIVETGARLICWTSLVLDEVNKLAQSCIDGSKPMRLGAAKVYSNNLRFSKFAKRCEEVLKKLLFDADEQVRDIAANSFRLLQGNELGNTISLIETFVESPDFLKNCGDLIFALNKTTARLPDITCFVCERLLDTAGNTASDIRTRTAFDVSQATQVLFRIYSQTQNEQIHLRCLNLIDRLLELGTHGVERLIEPYDRQ